MSIVNQPYKKTVPADVVYCFICSSCGLRCITNDYYLLKFCCVCLWCNESTVGCGIYRLRRSNNTRRYAGRVIEPDNELWHAHSPVPYSELFVPNFESPSIDSKLFR